MARRKTYKKKSTAKNARTKGQSVYKVKGGYRISKRRKRRGLARPAVLVALLLMIGGVFTLSGCTEPQRKIVDDVAEKTQEVAESVGTAVSSPAGQVIPEPYRTGALLLAGVLGSVAAGWQTIRKAAVQAALSDVVIGNERFLKAAAANVEEFKKVQDSIQSPATRKAVKQILQQGY